jgi:hypothetical protein
MTETRKQMIHSEKLIIVVKACQMFCCFISTILDQNSDKTLLNGCWILISGKTEGIGEPTTGFVFSLPLLVLKFLFF